MVTVFGLAIAPTTAIILLVVALIIFGPGKLPDLGKALGKGIKEFKSASDSPDQDPTSAEAPAASVTTEETKANS